MLDRLVFDESETEPGKTVWRVPETFGARTWDRKCSRFVVRRARMSAHRRCGARCTYGSPVTGISRPKQMSFVGFITFRKAAADVRVSVTSPSNGLCSANNNANLVRTKRLNILVRRLRFCPIHSNDAHLIEIRFVALANS